MVEREERRKDFLKMYGKNGKDRYAEQEKRAEITEGDMFLLCLVDGDIPSDLRARILPSGRVDRQICSFRSQLL